MPIDTILLAIPSRDEPQIAALAEAATDLAVPTGARVVIAHVFDEEAFETGLSDLKEPGQDADLSPDDLAGRTVATREVAAVLEAADVEFEVRGRVSEEPADAIVELANAVGADRLLVGGRRRTPAGKAVFGSTAQAVLLNAPCPVEFVRRD